MQSTARAITPKLLTALKDTPAVMLVGPRQAGKSTLVKEIASGPHPARYISLDDLRVLESAHRDPIGMIERADGPLVIDEIQRAPELLLPIKAAIDADRRPGRFMLTGSAQVMLLPTVSESLAGRIEIHTLWPFAQAELAQRPMRIVEQLLCGCQTVPDAPAVSMEELIDRLVRGGFPEAVGREDDRREQWLATYLSVLVQGDLRDLTHLERLSEVPQILSSLAGRVRAPLNKTSLGSSVGISRTTLDRYLSLLEHVFLTRRVPAYHTNRVKQVTKAPKMLVSDSAVLCHLLRASRKRLCEDDITLGIALECFVGMELAKQAAASALSAEVLHMRTATGSEIDFMLEGRDGTVAGVEVKAGATVRGADFKHLEKARDRLGERFARGVVLYPGGERLSFGERLEAWPLSSLWA